MNDPSSFRPRHIIDVWGDRPLCIFTLKNKVEFHHVLGRGYNIGADRAVMSSILNCIPLCHEIHAGPMRDNPYIRAFFLSKAEQHVMNAVGLGAYKITDNDEAFRQVSGLWLRAHGFCGDVI